MTGLTIHYSDILQDLSAKVYRRGIDYSLDRYTRSLEALGYPHKSLPPVIHVAGTNGKGSTVAFVSAALRACGLRVGTYTSPHIRDYTERIAIDNDSIGEDQFVDLYLRLKQLPEFDALTEFEALTLMSFMYFSDKAPDFICYETGLGGRLDATNVVDPVMSVITSIGMDHEAILGHSLEAITQEKAGIIKSGRPVVSGVTQPELAAIIKETALDLGSGLTIATPAHKIDASYAMQGDFQRHNLGVATVVIDTLATIYPNKIDLAAARAGFAQASIWGRFTVIERPKQTIVIDSAHNPDGIRALIDSIRERFGDQPFSVLVGILKRKDAAEMLSILGEAAERIYYCPFDEELGHSYSYISELTCIQPYRLSHWSRLDSFPPDPLTIVCGSILFTSLFE